MAGKVLERQVPRGGRWKYHSAQMPNDRLKWLAKEAERLEERQVS